MGSKRPTAGSESNHRRQPTPRIIDRLEQFDADQDGKLSVSEMPEDLRGMISKNDSNGDGQLDRQELRNAACRQTSNNSGATNNSGSNRNDRGSRNRNDRIGPGHPAFGRPAAGGRGGPPRGPDQLLLMRCSLMRTATES